MKKILLMAGLALIALAATAQPTLPGTAQPLRFRDYKNNYNPKLYHSQKGDPYSRGLAGITSFLLPGVGQAIDGEWGRGVGFFAGFVTLDIWSSMHVSRYEDACGRTQYEVDDAFYLIHVARLALTIWSVCDAVRVAKIKNMYAQDQRRKDQGLAAVDFRVEPFLTCVECGGRHPQGSCPAAGLSLRLSF